MVQFMENKQKHLTICPAEIGLLRNNYAVSTLKMFVRIINVLSLKEGAP